MKHILLITSLVLAAWTGRAQCTNGDAELNSFAGWNTYIGSNPSAAGLDLSPLNFTSVIPMPGRHTITSGTGSDAVVGAPIPVVGEGNFSFRLGNNSGGAEAEIMSYNMIYRQDFSFIYAMVLNNTHATTDTSITPTAFFRVWISLSPVLETSTDPGNLIFSKKFVPPVGSSNPYYHEWTKICPLQLDPTLSTYINQPVTIYFATGDCTAGGSHFGYAYIDGLCKMNDAVPVVSAPATIISPTDPITVNGSASKIEAQYYWKINKCTSGGADIAGTSVNVPSTAPSSPSWGNAGLFNVRAAYTGTYPINDNDYLKVTLYVRSCQRTWASASRIIHINYP
jgi:hypothetical protein